LGETPPPAPGWFQRAIAQEPEASRVQVAGVEIETLTWGERGKPGLLLVPGLFAHAHWWSFIAPLFASDFRVTAVSLSGMGGSGWRDAYAYPVRAEELHASALATGLFESGVRPIYVGHSYGGWSVFWTALNQPDRMAAGILIDVGLTGTVLRSRERAAKAEREAPAPRTFATLAEAMRGFRLDPPQLCSNLYLADYVARRSLRATEDGGYVWTFDPSLVQKTDFGNMRSAGRAPAPLAHIMGDNSLVRFATGGDQLPAFRNLMRVIRIPEAAHHVMLDQPLALVAAIRGALANWPPALRAEPADERSPEAALR
jgi:pimeloyl-ACP methyl ester carboxylesterase